MKKERKSAGELMRELSADPKYVTAQRERERQTREKREQFARDEEPILADLRAVGTPVGSVWDLVNTGARYPAAIPVLLAHIQKSYPQKIREGLARALAVPEARSGWSVLMHEFESDPDSTTLGPKYGLACALSVVADDNVLHDVLRVLREDRHGECRIPLLRVLVRSRDPEAKAALEQFEQDPGLAAEVALLRNRGHR